MREKTEDLFDVGGKKRKTYLIRVPDSIGLSWQELVFWDGKTENECMSLCFRKNYSVINRNEAVGKRTLEEGGEEER